MNKKFIKVDPSDYDVQALQKAAQSGTLFIAVEEESVNSISLSDYVRSIEEFAALEYKAKVRTIWRKIEESDLFDLTMVKGKHKGELCRYRVMGLVTYLCNQGVYVGTPLRLFYKLEQTGKKTSIYTNSAKLEYAVKDNQRPFLKQLLASMAEV